MAAMGELLMKRLIQIGATVAIGAGVASKALYNGKLALAVRLLINWLVLWCLRKSVLLAVSFLSV